MIKPLKWLMHTNKWRFSD